MEIQTYILVVTCKKLLKKVKTFNFLPCMLFLIKIEKLKMCKAVFTLVFTTLSIQCMHLTCSHWQCRYLNL